MQGKFDEDSEKYQIIKGKEIADLKLVMFKTCLCLSPLFSMDPAIILNLSMRQNRVVSKTLARGAYTPTSEYKRLYMRSHALP